MSYIKIGKQKIKNVKFAITDKEQSAGLMFSDWPPDIMIFPYTEAQVRKFWMKNTPVPLDIIFCRANKIVGIVVGKPFSEKNIGPDEPSDLVIEVPGGYCACNNISIGDSVFVKYDKNTLCKLLSYQHNKS